MPIESRGEEPLATPGQLRARHVILPLVRIRTIGDLAPALGAHTLHFRCVPRGPSVAAVASLLERRLQVRTTGQEARRSGQPGLLAHVDRLEVLGCVVLLGIYSPDAERAPDERTTIAFVDVVAAHQIKDFLTVDGSLLHGR